MLYELIQQTQRSGSLVGRAAVTWSTSLASARLSPRRAAEHSSEASEKQAGESERAIERAMTSCDVTRWRRRDVMRHVIIAAVVVTTMTVDAISLAPVYWNRTNPM